MTVRLAGCWKFLLYFLGLMVSGRLIYNLSNNFGSSVKRNFATKMSWQEQKSIFENMPLEEKRKQYKNKNYITLDQIEVWGKQPGKPGIQARDVEFYEKGQFRRRNELDQVLANKISIWKGDITKLEVDAVVNAANSKLAGGAGVDGAIHNKAGNYLLAECKDIGGCPTGEARITSGYQMPAKHVIHTVGPRDKSQKALTNCYKNSFQLVKENGIKSVAFPCVGTGVYGFPNDIAAHIALSEARKFLEEGHLENNREMERIIFCVFEPKDEAIYKSAAQLYFPNEGA